MSITVYEIDKEGKLICTRKGNIEMIINSIELSGNSFTLTEPPNKDGSYRWVNSEWVLDDSVVADIKIKNQNQMWEVIKDRRSQAITSGVFLSEIDKWFHTDEVTMATYAHLGNLITLGLFQNTQWKVMDNTFITLTEDLYKKLQVAIYKQTQYNYEIAEYHKSRMLLMDNPLEYDYSTKWSDDPK